MKQLTLVCGAERSGKTFFVEKLANAANQSGKTVIAYNKGLDKDFSDFEEVYFLDQLETEEHIYSLHGKEGRRRYRRSPQCLYFEYQGQIHHFKRFNAILGGKKIAIYRTALENSFFKGCFHYIGNAFFIGDDFRVVTRNGLSNNLLNFLNRKNHTGFKSTSRNCPNGCDIALIYHNIDLINGEIFDYATHLIIYATNQNPKCSRIENDEISSLVKRAASVVNSEKKKAGEGNYYDCLQIDIRGKDQGTIKRIKGEFVYNL